MTSTTDIRRRSPLAANAPVETGDGSYRVEERPFLAKFVVRAAQEFATKPLRGLTGRVPPKATRAVEGKGVTVIWLGPDEYLVVGAPDTGAALEDKLARGFAGTHHQIADVGDYYTTITVTGAFAREALSRLSTLDLHPSKFAVGDAVSSTFAKAQAVLHLREGPRGESFDFHVRWSMAAYMWALLLEAARVKGIKAPPKMAVKWSINPEH